MSAKSSLGFTVTVEEANVQVEVPTRLNIKKRHENVVYRTKTDKTHVNLSYVTSKPVTSAYNLFVSERGSFLVGNRLTIDEVPVVFDGISFSFHTDKFILTDRFTEQNSAIPSQPLFYKHTLSQYNSSLSDFADRTLVSVEFTDENLKAIAIKDYQTDSGKGDVYSNLRNSYDPLTTRFNVYFIRYTVKLYSGAAQRTAVYYELLESNPVYVLADFDDIDSSGKLITSVKKYLVEPDPGGVTYSITLPIGGKYAYKETEESRIRLEKPTAFTLTEPWTLRLTNGNFVQALRKSPEIVKNHKYYLPEFNSQTFSPYPPYKYQIEQECIYITPTVILLQKNIVNDPSSGFVIEVVVYDSGRNVKYVYTTDPDKLNTLYLGSYPYTDGISSVSQTTGFIEISDEILDTDIVEATYYTDAKYYDIVEVDFNPVTNRDILEKKAVFYLNPETNSTGTLSNTLHYLLTDSVGKITYSSQAANAPVGILDGATQKLLDEDFNTDGTPQHEFYYDMQSTASGLQVRASGIYLDKIHELSFVDKYTVESQLFETGVLPSGLALENYIDNPKFLILGDVSVGVPQSPAGLTDFDIRVNGGGIIEGQEQAAYKVEPEVSWYLDLNVERPYPSAGAFVVEVPKTLFTEYGGEFTEDGVRDIVHRHMDASGWGILKKYGIDPVFTGGLVTSGLITVQWPTYGADITYNLYYSTDIDTGFAKLNFSEIVDVAPENEFTVSGLTASTTYYFKIGAVDTEDREFFGPTVALTTSGLVTA